MSGCNPCVKCEHHIRLISRTCILIAVIAVVVVSPAAGQTGCAVQKLLPSDGAERSDFGTAAIGNGIAVIGAVEYFRKGEGSVYVFRLRDGKWVETAKLLPVTGGGVGSFGHSVLLGTDVIAVGAGFGETVHVFRNDGEEWRMDPVIRSGFVRVGGGMAMSGDTILTGHYWNNQLGVEAGAVAEFTYDGTRWVEGQTILPADGRPELRFGWWVNCVGDIACIAAPGANERTGKVYVLRRDSANWTEIQSLVPEGGRPGDLFGEAMAMTADLLAVGAPCDDDRGIDAGAVYVYRYDGEFWQQEQKLIAEDTLAGDRFGTMQAIHRDTILVGTPYADQGTGAAYVFRRGPSGWRQTRRLVAPDSEKDDGFGFSVAVYDDTVIVGARFDDDNGENSGSAWVFDLSGRDENGDDLRD